MGALTWFRETATRGSSGSERGSIANFAERGELGAAVCVIVDGETVVDLWGGDADRATGRPWERDTMNIIMSRSKGVTRPVRTS
jgi:CubicO group peptidase (beta-lactamase class C family)